MHGDCSIRVGGVGFSPEQIRATAEAKKLLVVEVELSNRPICSCIACRDKPQQTLNYDEIADCLRQAKDLGASKCILLDSLDPPYQYVNDLIAHLAENGWDIELFIPDRELTAGDIETILGNRVFIVVETANRASQCRALLALTKLGHRRLSIRPTLSGISPNAIANWWRDARRLGVEPLVQTMTPAGSTQLLTGDEIRVQFEALHRIDRDEFKIAWENPPELTGRSCHRHQYAVHVTPCGTIQACVGITIPLGNIRSQSLQTITDESEVLENLRDYRQRVKAPCKACCQTVNCYGCRGSAYQLTGDYLAGDGLCWKADGVVIPSFPMPAGQFIPHGPAAQMVDQVLSVGERLTRTDTKIRETSLLVDESGFLDETAYIEMIAQSFAASHGVHLTDAERAVHRGMLIGVKDLSIFGQARVGERLITEVRKVARFGDFGVVEGVISREDGTILARGEIKVWRSAGQEPQAQP